MPDTNGDLDALVSGLADLAPVAPDDTNAGSLEASGEGWLAENVRVLSAIAAHASQGDDPLPEPIGPYTPLERIGSGGMGDVFLARQDAPLRRLVALKRIRPGMDSRRVLARFDAERQALALMDHPGVAKVFDAGAGDDGRPWFAMEYVRGVPLTDYCDRNRLPPRERIELLASVCDAVHHAHQRGVIHRDLKPTNLLVEVVNDRPVAKVIDFGVAKAMGPELSDGLHTELGQLVGTPEYMSPEQAEMTGRNVDTRTDIYALGVVLYELLTGSLPFPSDVLRRDGVGEIHRILRDTDAPRPSTRAARGGGDMAAQRRTSTTALARRLRGDLDWITMKAMDKDRASRYASASELAEDLRRHLRDEPVLAGPPGARYRIGKFARRHRTGVVVSAVLALSLFAGAIATAWQATRATQAERAARKEAAVARAVNAFVTDMLAQASPETNPLGHELGIGEILDIAAARLPDAFPDQPEVEAGVRETIGDAYLSLARYDDARTHFETALSLRRSLDDGEGTAAALARLVSVEIAASRPDDASRWATEAFEWTSERVPASSPAAAVAVVDLARVAYARGAFPEADSLYRVARSRMDASPNADLDRVASVLASHAQVLQRLGAFEEAEGLHRDAVRSIEARHGRDHPNTIRAALALGQYLQETGRFRDALDATEPALESARRVFGDDHPDVAQALSGVGSALTQLGEGDRAESLLREAVAIQTRFYGPASRPVGVQLSHLGALLLSLRRLDDAESTFREALAIHRATNDAPETFYDANNLAATLRLQGRFDDAEVAFREALRVGTPVFGGESHTVAQVRGNLAKTLSDAGRYDQAEDEFDVALTLAANAFPKGHVTVDILRGNYGELLLRRGRLAEAEPILLEVHAAITGALGEGHARAKIVAGWLSVLYERRGAAVESRHWRDRAGDS